MRTFEYGAVSLQAAGERGVLFLGEWGLGSELDGLAWTTRTNASLTQYFIASPATVANHLGLRGWETFQVAVSHSPTVWTYHVRRSSDDKSLAGAPAGG